MTMDEMTETIRHGPTGGNSARLLLLAALSVSILACAFYANAWKSERRVERVVVEGTRILSAEELVALADVPLHARLFELDLYAIAQRVAQHHYVKDVAVHRDLPDRIRIVVREREPVAVLARGSLPLVDADGYVLPPVRSPQIFDLPIISVSAKPQECVPGKRTTNGNVLLALDLLALARSVDPDVYRNISEIGGDRTSGFVLHTAEWGVPVLLGTDRFGQKLVIFSAFWKNVAARNGADGLEYIDLRFTDQVVVRWNRHITDVPSS